jgi:NTP pyrophosphatase (non-canonical NTP hydrolase)
MELIQLQKHTKNSVNQVKTPFGSGTEIMLALTEELGEIAKEVALLKQIGSKTEWHQGPSKANLAEEMIHAMNLLMALANHFELDLSQAYIAYQEKDEES